MFEIFLKNAFIYGLGKAGAAVAALLMLPVLTHALGVAEFGFLEWLNLIVVFLGLCVALEVSQAVARFMSECKTVEEKATYVSSAFFFALCAYGVAAVLIYYFGGFLLRDGGVQFASHQNNILAGLGLWTVFGGMSAFVMNQLRWDNRPVAYIALQNLRGFLVLFLFLGFFYLGGWALFGAIYAHVVAFAIACCVGGFLLVRSGSLAWRFDASVLRTMLLFSLPLVPSSLSVFLQNYVDRFMVAEFLGMVDLGLYSLAFKIAAALAVLTGLFQTAIVPLIYEHFQKKETPAQIVQSFYFFLFALGGGAVALSVLTPEILALFIHADYHAAAALIPVLAFSVLMAAAYIFAPGLMIAKKTSMVAAINIAGMVVNIGLNFIGMYFFGIMGVAVATLVSQTLVTFTHFYFSQTHYPIPFSYARIVTFALLCLCFVAGFTLFVGYEVQPLSWEGGAAKVGALAAFAVTGFFIFWSRADLVRLREYCAASCRRR